MGSQTAELVLTTDAELHHRGLQIRGQGVRTTPKEFQLYCYLVAKKLVDPEGGRIAAVQVQELRLWNQLAIESVGKEISRIHKKTPERLRVILAEDGNMRRGPYRLGIDASRITSSMPAEQLIEALFRDNPIGNLPRQQRNRFLEFLDAVCAGDRDFEAQQYAGALSKYDRALRLSVLPHQTTLALLLKARVHLKRGTTSHALKIHNSVRDRLRHLHHLRLWAQTRLTIQEAWYEHERGNLKEAERRFRTAFAGVWGSGMYSVLSDICDGLGVVSSQQARYDEAMSFFIKGLDYAIIDNDFSEIMKILFDIVDVHSHLINDLEANNQTAAARREAQAACEVLKRAQRVDPNAQEPWIEMMLSDLRRYLNELPEALDHAFKAAHIAAQSLDERVLCTALRSAAIAQVKQIVNFCRENVTDDDARSLLGADIIALADEACAIV